MAVLKVRRYGDPVLRRRAEEIATVTPEIRRLAEDMIETMYDEVGIGLAAPQIGASVRLLVVGDEEGRGAQALVNPVITEQGGTVTAEEGLPVAPRLLRAGHARAVGEAGGAGPRRPAGIDHRPRPALPRVPARDRPPRRRAVHRSRRCGDPRPDQAPHQEGRLHRGRRRPPRLRAVHPLKVLFYGTPAFALPTLEALRRAHTIVTVVTQPDRPAHRGQQLTPPPVKLPRSTAGLPVLQPPRLRDPEWPERLRALGADVAVVVAFGQILPQAVLDAPARGSINIHGSLLPSYRGAAPIQWAIIRGETVTGITTFQMDAGMDTGAMLLRAETPIGPEETAGELSERLARLGAEVILDTLARLDSLTPTPQPEGATLAPRLKKTDGAHRLAAAGAPARRSRPRLQPVARRDDRARRRRAHAVAGARRARHRHAGHAR